MYEAFSHSGEGEKTAIIQTGFTKQGIIDWENLADDFIFHEKINYNSGNLLSTIAGVVQETPEEALYQQNQQMQEDKEREEQVSAVVGGEEIENMRNLLGLSDTNEEVASPNEKTSIEEKITDLFNT